MLEGIPYTLSGNHTFYAYGFAKAGMDNISEKQLRNFKMAAKTVFGYSERELDDRVKTGLYMKI